MKICKLLSVAMTAFIGVSHVYAYSQTIIPESTADINACNSWAETYRETVHYEPALKRCIDLNNCMENHSTNENASQKCTLDAESRFHRAINDLNQPGVASSGVTSSTVTGVSNSAYEERDGGKGYGGGDADQGG